MCGPGQGPTRVDVRAAPPVVPTRVDVRGAPPELMRPMRRLEGPGLMYRARALSWVPGCGAAALGRWGREGAGLRRCRVAKVPRRGVWRLAVLPDTLVGMYVCPECGRSAAAGGFCTEDGATLERAQDPLLGSLVGSYRITRLVGFGAMGAVYMAVHPGIGSRVAVKVLNQDPSRSPALVDRFFAEARAVNLIRHEHIVNVLDLSQLPDGRPYIVMEYLDGAPMAALFEAGSVPIGTLARVVGEVLDALGSAHDKGVVHRDLKPDNLHVTPAGHVKVLDFGIAKLRSEAPGSGTRTGSLLGTPHYMSPEQALGKGVDARADLYAIGVVLYEGATGQKPFDAPALFDLLRKHVEEPPRPPTQLRPDLPPAYESVILKAMAKDPAARYQTAQEFSQALLDATRSLPDSAWAPVSTGGAVAAAMQSRARSGIRSTAPMQEVPANAGAATSPTVPSAGTYAGASLPAAAATPVPKKSGMGYLLAAIGAVVLLAGLLGLGVVVLVGGFLVSEDSTASAPGAPDPAEPFAVSDPEADDDDDDDPLVLPGLPKPGPKVDIKNFDVWAFFPEAERISKTHAADARFVRLDASGIKANGKVDLSFDMSSSVLYRFRSPSLSVRPAGHPDNAPFKSKCYVYVNVAKDGVTSFLAQWTCDMPFLPKPRCSPVQVWNRAEAMGAPRGNLIGNLGYWADSRGRGRWHVTIRPSFSKWVPDSC